MVSHYELVSVQIIPTVAGCPSSSACMQKYVPFSYCKDLPGSIAPGSDLVQNFVDLKCKFVCMRLCLGLLARSGNHCENHEMSNNIFQRTSILLDRDQVLDTSVNDWESYLLLLVNEVPGDSLSIELAELLHYIYCRNIVAHEPSHDFVQEDELLLLLQAFVLCREVPVLFQKMLPLESMPIFRDAEIY